MVKREPKPFISAYFIRSIKIALDPYGRVSLEWATRDPVAVNTFDVTAIVNAPNTFIWGWQETHFDEVSEQVKGQIIDRYRELTFYKDHTVNQQLLAKMIVEYGKASQMEGVVQLPPVKSFEQILISLGWQFNYRPVGEEDLMAAVIPEALKEKIKAIPQLQFMLPTLDSDFTVGQHDVSAYNTLQPSDAPEPGMPKHNQDSTKLDALELKVDTLTKLLEQVLGASNASSNSSGAS